MDYKLLRAEFAAHHKQLANPNIKWFEECEIKGLQQFAKLTQTGLINEDSIIRSWGNRQNYISHNS